MHPPLVIVKAGDAQPVITERRGDYDDWFRRTLDGPTVVCQAHRDEPLPEPRDCAGVLITGSSRSVLDDEPWMRRLADWLRVARDEDLPVLGVCFGHQLVCQAFGAQVERNPRGWELATREIALTADGRADPLFEGLPDRFAVQMSHRDHVTDLGSGFRLLATNGHSAVQAVAVDDHIRAVQFHPEADQTIARLFITCRAGVLREEGLDPDQLCRQVTTAPLQERVIRNFEKNFARRR